MSSCPVHGLIEQPPLHGFRRGDYRPVRRPSASAGCLPPLAERFDDEVEHRREEDAEQRHARACR